MSEFCSEGEKAFDGNLNTAWISHGDDNDPWLKIEFISEIIINKVIVNSGVSVPYATVPTNATVFGSVDDKNWIELGSDALSTIELGIVKPFKFYKFHFIGPKFLSVSNIEMFEYSVIDEMLLSMNHYQILHYIRQNLYQFWVIIVELNENVITDSNFSVPIGRPGQSSDIVDKQYVDSLTGLVSGEGLVRTSNGLATDITIPMFVTSVAFSGNQYTSKAVPVVGIDTQNNRIVISNSTKTIGQNATSDLVDKLYVDGLTNYVLGGGLTRGSSGLTTDSNVPLLVFNILFANQRYQSKFVPIMGLDTQTNRIVLSNSNYTLDKNSTGDLVDRSICRYHIF